MTIKFTLAAMTVATLAAPVGAADIAKLAADYGAREAASGMQLSPDGDKVVYIAPARTRGTAAMVVDLKTNEGKIVLGSTGDTYDIDGCNWKSSERLICATSGVSKTGESRIGYSSLISVKADGTGAIELQRRSTDTDRSAYLGSALIDLLPDDPKHVLMVVGLPERNTTGSLIARPSGLSVQLVDVATGKMTTFQQPKPNAIAFGSDGRGNVRFMETGSYDADGDLRADASYLVRPKAGGDWRNLGKVTLSNRSTLAYRGFDESGEGVFMLREVDGRRALYREAADGSGAPALVFAHPEVDIDGLLRIGKYRRPVAAAYAVDIATYNYFDPVLAKRHSALSNALPGKPPINIVDESWDGRYNLIAAGGVSDPGTYYRFDTVSKQLGALLPLRPQMAAYKTAPETGIVYTVADGTKVPAYLTLPPGSAGKNLPAIIMPHGGPSARDRLGFDWLAQFYAQLGYVVLQPNYRGSSGYGAAWYAKNGFQSWKTAIGDVNDAARWLIAQGIADRTRMTIVGWSYGGYAALQANVVDPGLYKAVVAIAPVTDLAMLRDNARYYGNYQITINEVGTGPHVSEGSPAQHADRIQAPVLMFQGDRDINVEPKQAAAMDAALARAGKRHQLIVYPGMDHYMGDSAVRADMLAKSAEWLAAAVGK